MIFVGGQPQNLGSIIVVEIFPPYRDSSRFSPEEEQGGGLQSEGRFLHQLLLPSLPIFFESNLVPSATAHTEEVFGQSLFASAGK